MDKRIYTDVLSDLWQPCVFCWAPHKRHMNITFRNSDGKSARWAWMSVSKVCSANSAERCGKTDEDASRNLRKVRTMDLWASSYRPPSDKQAETCRSHTHSDLWPLNSILLHWMNSLQSNILTFHLTQTHRPVSLFPPNSSHDSHFCWSETKTSSRQTHRCWTTGKEENR